jgi:hypothetical protein
LELDKFILNEYEIIESFSEKSYDPPLGTMIDKSNIIDACKEPND